MLLNCLVDLHLIDKHLNKLPRFRLVSEGNFFFCEITPELANKYVTGEGYSRFFLVIQKWMKEGREFRNGRWHKFSRPEYSIDFVGWKRYGSYTDDRLQVWQVRINKPITEWINRVLASRSTAKTILPALNMDLKFKKSDPKGSAWVIYTAFETNRRKH